MTSVALGGEDILLGLRELSAGSSQNEGSWAESITRSHFKSSRVPSRVIVGRYWVTRAEWS